MKTLWTFGDSLTDSFLPPVNSGKHWRHQYTEWKGYTPLVYGEHISNKLNLSLINKGIAGASNAQIFEEFCKVSHCIEDGDILIFGWTNIERFRLVSKDGNWINIFANLRLKQSDKNFLDETIDDLDSITKETIFQTMFNRSNDLYISELESWINLINTSFKNNKILHWTWDNRKINKCVNIRLENFENITLETNNYINDKHLSELGQRDISEYMIKLLTNNFIENKNMI
jgi:hypothetical protein